MNAPAHFPEQQIRNRLTGWRPEIERALLQFGMQDFDDIADEVMSGRKFFFDNDEAFAIVEINNYTNGKVAHVLVAGGTMKGFRKLQSITTDFFRLLGVKKMSMLGRRGFLRRLPDMGWKQTMTYMERIL
jgi:hypothetical protein